MNPDVLQVPPGGQRTTVREFLAVVFRRRWIILGLFLVTTVTVVTIALTTPALYISGGQVLVRRGERQSIMNPDRQVINDWEIELGSEIETVKSWPVLARAQKILDEEGRGARGVKLTERGVAVEVTGKSNVLAIAYVDRDPEAAQQVCDALIRAYVDYRQSGQVTYPRRFFDVEIGRAAAELQRWTELRRQYSNQTGAVDIPEQRRHLLGLLTELERRRSETRADLAQAESEQRVMRQLKEQPDIDLPTVGSVTLGDDVIAGIKSSMVQQESRIAELRERYRDESPQVMNARVTLDTLRAMLGREVEARLAVSRSRAEVVRARLEVLDREIAATNAKLETMPDQDARLTEMNHEIDSWKTRHEQLLGRSDEALINENTIPLISVYVLNPASQARRKNARDYVRVGLAPAFSLLVGVGIAFFIDGLDITVHTAGQAEEEVHLPVLAALTDRKRRGWRPHGAGPERTPA
jgi:succinoglycan biosynthesis transport protein ExoP